MRLVSCDACYYDNSIWFVDKDLSALFRTEGNVRTCKLVCFLPREKNLFFPYANVVACNGKIVCVPGVSRFISIYDIKAEKLTCISIRNIERREDLFFFPGDKCVFEAAVAYENFVYMFGGSHGCVLKLNVETGGIEAFKEICEGLLGRINSEDAYKPFFSRDMCVLDDTAWIASSFTDAVLEFSLSDASYHIYHPGYCKEGYIGICYGGKNGEFYLTVENEGTLIKWNKDSNQITNRISFEQENADLRPCRLLYGFGNIYVFMQSSSRVFRYSIENGTIRSKVFTDGVDVALDCSRYQYVHILDGKLYVSASDTGSVYVLNEALAQHNRILWRIGNEQLQNKPVMMRADMLEKGEDFINNNRGQIPLGEKRNYGQEIYNYLKQLK